MTNIPTLTRNLPEAKIASYDFIELTSGTGYIRFYLTILEDKRVLTTNVCYSKDIVEKSVNMDTIVNTKQLDHNYDTNINMPMIIEGLGVVNIGIAQQSGTGGPYVTRGTIIAKLRKYSGSTETDIATNESEQYVNPAQSTKYDMTAIDLTIPKTHFKIGDILRLTIELWGVGNTSASYVSYAADPKGRTTDWDTTGVVPSTATIDIPFKVEL